MKYYQPGTCLLRARPVACQLRLGETSTAVVKGSQLMLGFWGEAGVCKNRPWVKHSLILYWRWVFAF